MTDREIMQQALDALEYHTMQTRPISHTDKAIEALKAALAQPEQEEPLPLVDIGVDVTLEGTHVVACYNRPDAVQEMFYSQFHPLTKPEQEPVCDKDPSLCGFVQCQLGKVCKHTAPFEQEELIQFKDDKWSYVRKPWQGLTDEQLSETYNELYTQYTKDDVNIADFILIARTIESQLKELNT